MALVRIFWQKKNNLSCVCLRFPKPHRFSNSILTYYEEKSLYKGQYLPFLSKITRVGLPNPCWGESGADYESNPCWKKSDSSLYSVENTNILPYKIRATEALKRFSRRVERNLLKVKPSIREASLTTVELDKVERGRENIFRK